jgi:hypothetical protein
MRPVSPPADDYPTFIEAAIRALVSDGIADGATALEPIAYTLPQVIAPRPSVPLATAARLLKCVKYDHFSCRYCARKTIPAPIMAPARRLLPPDLSVSPQLKGWRYPSGEYHPQFGHRPRQSRCLGWRLERG